MSGGETTWSPLCVAGAWLGVDARARDHRGYTQDLYRDDSYPEHVQPPEPGHRHVSLSHSHRGVLRGLLVTYRSRLVSVVKGAIYDVIVDCRPESRTYRRWCVAIVSSANRRQVFVPGGCAHGFLVLEDADVLVHSSTREDPENELTINARDPALGVYWPRLDDVREAITSDEDGAAPPLLQAHDRFVDTVPGVISSHWSPYELVRVVPRPLGRALVVGASGNVGGAIEEKYGAANVIGTYKNEARTEDGYVYLDIEAVAEDETLAEEIMTMCRPEVVFICAGFNWVDGCENEAEGLRPRNMNAVGPRNLAVAAKKVGAKVVYFSTDAVFIGNETGKVYAEADEFLPQNKFGETKLLGEQLVTAVCPERTLVIRTAGVFGPERVGKNFVYRMCEAINDADDMAVPTDRFCSHVYNRDLAASVKGLVDSDAAGTFHVVGEESFSRFNFAQRVAVTLGFKDTATRVIKRTDLKTMHDQTFEARGFAAERPKNLALAADKLKETLPERMRPKPLREALLHWKTNPRGARCPGIGVRRAEGE